MVTRELSRRAAEQGAVLLKNQGAVLPLQKDKKVTVIGDRAFRASIGGGGSSAVHPYFDPVPALDVLHHELGGEQVRAARGIDELPGHVSIQEDAWGGAQGMQGVRAEYFDNIQLEGPPALSRAEPRIAFEWSRFSPQAAIPVAIMRAPGR